MGSILLAVVTLFIGVTLSLPLKNNEVDDFVFRANDLSRFSPYPDEGHNVYMVRSLDSIGGGHLIRSLGYNENENGDQVRQHSRRSALPDVPENDWNIATERRNPYSRYSWPKYVPIHANFRRALDSIGGGNLIKRTLDSIGGANLLRKRRLSTNPLLYDYYVNALAAIYGRHEDDPSLESTERRVIPLIIKKNFDEIDRTGFKHLKRNFDEIDRVGFSELKRSV